MYCRSAQTRQCRASRPRDLVRRLLASLSHFTSIGRYTAAEIGIAIMDSGINSA